MWFADYIASLAKLHSSQQRGQLSKRKATDDSQKMVLIKKSNSNDNKCRLATLQIPFLITVILIFCFWETRFCWFDSNTSLNLKKKKKKSNFHSSFNFGFHYLLIRLAEVRKKTSHFKKIIQQLDMDLEKRQGRVTSQWW